MVRKVVVTAEGPVMGSSMGQTTTATTTTTTKKTTTTTTTTTKTFGTVSCYLTVDNVLTQVTYNGKNLTTNPSSKNGDWSKPKNITFTEVAAGVLAISGYNSESTTGSGTCNSAGLMMTCKSSNTTSGWHNWIAQKTNMRSYGASTKSGATTGWHAQKFNDTAWKTPCASTSGFHMTAPAGYKKTTQKIWGANKYSWFRSKQR